MHQLARCNGPNLLRSVGSETGQLPQEDSLKRVLTVALNDIHQAGTYKQERLITTPQASEVAVEGVDGHVVNFCANNYLGLSNHPKLVAAARSTLDSHGYGLSSVRFICGTQYR